MYEIKKKVEGSVNSLFYNETEARDLALQVLFCGRVVYRGYKDRTAACIARKYFDRSVGMFDSQRCYGVEEVFFDQTYEDDIIIAYPVV